MTFKNQQTAYFSLRAVTNHANEQQDLRGYWTKIHRICSHSNFSSTVLMQQSALRSIHPLSNDNGNI